MIDNRNNAVFRPRPLRRRSSFVIVALLIGAGVKTNPGLAASTNASLNVGSLNACLAVRHTADLHLLITDELLDIVAVCEMRVRCNTPDAIPHYRATELSTRRLLMTVTVEVRLLYFTRTWRLRQCRCHSYLQGSTHRSYICSLAVNVFCSLTSTGHQSHHTTSRLHSSTSLLTSTTLPSILAAILRYSVTLTVRATHQTRTMSDCQHDCHATTSSRSLMARHTCTTMAA